MSFRIGSKPPKILLWCEVVIVFVVFLWTTVGAIRFAWATGGTLEGLLGTVDKNWKGVLIVASLLFYRTYVARGAGSGEESPDATR